jgi:hypothetical protein
MAGATIQIELQRVIQLDEGGVPQPTDWSEEAFCHDPAVQQK